jgi:hypothetical protein
MFTVKFPEELCVRNNTRKKNISSYLVYISRKKLEFSKTSTKKQVFSFS